MFLWGVLLTMVADDEANIPQKRAVPEGHPEQGMVSSATA
jgi:hypothetical protein